MGMKGAGRYGLGVILVTTASCGAAAAPTDASGGEPQAYVCDRDFGNPTSSPYTLPYRPGLTYTVIQSYCPSNPKWGHYGWYAYDFDMQNGDTILATRAGRIELVREDRPNIGGRCGGNTANLVLVRHDDGTLMHYVHLTTDGVLVEVGDRVERGQPIGLSGNSGCSSGPHLHVYLFRAGNDYTRTGAEPFNYSNAIGPLDDRRGLVYGGAYTATEPGGTP